MVLCAERCKCREKTVGVILRIFHKVIELYCEKILSGINYGGKKKNWLSSNICFFCETFNYNVIMPINSKRA